MLRFSENGISVWCWLGRNHTIPAKRRDLCRLPFPSGLGAMEAKMTPAGYTGRVLCFREHKKGCFCSAKQKNTEFKQSINKINQGCCREGAMI